MDTKVMQKQIMRRVYYSYMVSVVAHPMMWRGVFLGAATVALAEWLHVASIINNFLTVPVGAAPQYMYGSVVNAVTNGEMLTVLTLALSAVIALSTLHRLSKANLFAMPMMSRA